MIKFIRLNGESGNVSRFMELPALKDGCAWERDGDYGAWVETKTRHCEESNPNTNAYEPHIFGYLEKDLLAMQYK